MLMNSLRQSRKRLWLLALAVCVAGVALPLGGRLKADTPPHEASNLVIDYADQMNHLVMKGQFDQLASLKAPAATDPQVKTLDHWRDQYMEHIAISEKQRDEQYKKLIDKAQEYIKKDRFEEAIAQTVGADTIAKNKDVFLELDWVKDLTKKVADQAASFEKQGRWLESLQLYSDLNTLYEIDTRYKADMQRLTRRTRLLALYTPKVLFEMRKTITAKFEKERADDAAATQGATTQTATTQKDVDAQTATAKSDADEEATFPRWQDSVEKITPSMLNTSLERAYNFWVEQTDYETLVKGGIDALRLFLSTPELAKEFPGLADETARAKFAAEIDAEVAKLDPNNPMTRGQLEDTVDRIMLSNAQTIKLPEEVAVMEFTDGAMEKLDPFTAVIWPHEVDEFFQKHSGPLWRRGRSDQSGNRPA